MLCIKSYTIVNCAVLYVIINNHFSLIFHIIFLKDSKRFNINKAVHYT